MALKLEKFLLEHKGLISRILYAQYYTGDQLLHYMFMYY